MPRNGWIDKLLNARKGGRLRLFEDLAILAGGQFGGRLVGFLAFALLARALSPETYGAVEYIVGFSTFFATVVDGGLGTVGTRRASRDLGLIPRLAFQIVVARLIFAAVAVPAMVILLLTAQATTTPQVLVWLFAASLLFTPFRHEWMLQAAERMGALAFIQVLRPAVFAAAVWLLVRSDADVGGVGWGEVASVAAITVYCLVVQNRAMAGGAGKRSFDGFGDLMKEGAAVGLTNLVWALNQFAPLYLIGTLTGGAQTAWFAGAARVVSSLLIFSNLYHFNLFPAVSRATERGAEALRPLMSSSLRVSAWVGIAIAAAICLLAEPIVALVFGPKFVETAPILKVMVWALPIALCSGHARWGLAALGAQATVLTCQVIGLVAVVVPAAVLGSMFGAAGYAAATIIGPLLVWVLSHVAAARRGACPPPFLIVVRPLMLAAALLALQVGFDLKGWWWGSAGALLFVAAAPLLDRRLIASAVALGAAKRADRAG